MIQSIPHVTSCYIHPKMALLAPKGWTSLLVSDSVKLNQINETYWDSNAVYERCSLPHTTRKKTIPSNPSINLFIHLSTTMRLPSKMAFCINFWVNIHLSEITGMAWPCASSCTPYYYGWGKLHYIVILPHTLAIPNLQVDGTATKRYVRNCTYRT